MQTVGIMTWYYGANYGAVAQSIALYKTIEKLGSNPVMINYRSKDYKRIILRSNIPPKWRRIIRIKDTIRGFQKVKMLSDIPYLKETVSVSTADEINDIQIDRIVFGSDAIFNVKHKLCDPIYYGVGIKIPKVTYSPSCEYLSTDYNLPDDYKTSIQEMRSVSVRDKNTQILVKKNTGVDAELTVDPTYLYDFSEIPDEKVGEAYILIYSFSKWNAFKSEIRQYARNNNLRIISIGNYLSWADKSIVNASFEEWITAFKYASVVMTDSFHGTVFSLKNEKQIILCGRSDKKSKIESMLEQFEIQIEQYKGENIESYLTHNYIDYSNAGQKIEAERLRSLDYLRNALKA